MFFTPEDLRKLLENELVTFELIFGNVSIEELIALGKAVENNTSLLKLRLNYLTVNRLVMYILGKALGKNRTLQFLDLQRNGLIDKEVAIFFPILAVNRGLTSLNLSYNGLTDEAAIILAEALEKNNSLIFLDLSSNSITNEGAIALTRALLKNTSLQFMNLSSNKIDHKYLLCLHRFLKVNQKHRLNEQWFVLAAMVFIGSRKLPFDIVKIIFMYLAINLSLQRSEKEIEQMLRLVSQNIHSMPANKQDRELKWWKNEIDGKIIFRQCRASFFPFPIDPPLIQEIQDPVPAVDLVQKKVSDSDLRAGCTLI